MAQDVDTTAVFHPLRILVIEDNPDGRETLRVLLELLGHQVKVASDGLEGVALALSWGPDVALVDIGLPRLDGYEVARRLRAALGRRIFLIAQTGYGRPEDRRQGLAAGFDVHLVKPLWLEDLCHWLTVAAGRVAVPPDSGMPCRAPPCPDAHQARSRTAQV
jgi:CheY-like chemotaxis protein